MFTERRKFQTHGFTSLGNPIREEVFTSKTGECECSICGETFDHEEYGYASHCEYNICSDCFEKQKTVENAIDFARDCGDKVSVYINAAIAESLSEDEINTILSDYIKYNNQKYIFSAGGYIDRSKDEFAAYLEEKNS
jgi:hypothetical protein